jgi:hypothetical protein
VTRLRKASSGSTVRLLESCLVRGRQRRLVLCCPAFTTAHAHLGKTRGVSAEGACNFFGLSHLPPPPFLPLDT